VPFSERPPSKEWAVLKYRGEKFAEVWFKPEGEPLALTIRIPQGSFQILGMGELLTPENLLKAVGVTAEEVECWRHGGVSLSGTEGANPEWRRPLPVPEQDVSHLIVDVRMKPPPQAAPPAEAAAPAEGGVPQELLAKWQQLEARWTAIMGLEASLETLRLKMEGVQSELQAASRATLTSDEKVHALNTDVALWTKAKNRVHYTLPKVREFLHRATWATGTPERKKLGELFKERLRAGTPPPPMDGLPEQLDGLLKDRQVLSAQGVAVSQECSTVLADIQGALRTLQSNAAARAQKERGADIKRSKSLRL
jgi:hypothetical protein